MKSLALFLVLSIFFSYAMTLETTEGNQTSTETPCESKCLACQQTVYNLKFHKKANCKNYHCRSTCHKVWDEWNKPSSPFGAFQNDSVGKCEVCFRAGYCSINECSVQKNFEIAVIDKVVDAASLNGVVDKKEMKNMVSKILSGKKVNFKKIAKKVNKMLKKISKNIKLKTINKLSRTIKAVIVAKTPVDMKKLLARAQKHIKNFTESRVGISAKIKKLVASFKTVVEKTLVQSLKSKLTFKDKKSLKKTANTILKTINGAILKLNAQRISLEGVRSKIVLSNNKTAQKNLKKIDTVLKAIQSSLKEANDSVLTMKKLQETVDKF